jgi:hypothetical protein
MINSAQTFACDTCEGVGIIFWGNDLDYDCEPCDCVAENSDGLTLDWNE